MKKTLLALLLALSPAQAFAVALPIANVVTTCGTLSPAYLAGRDAPLTVDTTGTLCLNGGGGGGTPGGSSGQVQYNNAGAFGGITGATTNGVALTLVAPVLGTPASGTLTNATGLPISTGVSGLGTGVATFLGTPTSANLAAAITDETGSGLAVFATSPTLTTPTLGAALATTINGVTIPSATDTAALLGTAQTFTAKNTFAAGTITTSQPFTITQTWNAGGVTFTGLLENITATASAAGSLLMDLQVASVSQWNVTKAGAVTQLGGLNLPNGALATPTLKFGTDWGFYNDAGGGLVLERGGTTSNFYFYTTGPQFVLGSGGLVGWSSTSNATVTPDTVLVRDAANTLALRNGVNAQKYSVYNTFTDASNYERGIFDWAGSSNVLSIGTENAGTGSARNLRFLVGGTNRADYGITNAGDWTLAPSSGQLIITGVVANDNLVVLNGNAAANAQIFMAGGNSVNAAFGQHGTAAFAGSVTNNNFDFWQNGSAKWRIDTNGYLLAATDNTYDIGATGATRPRNIFIAGNGTFGGQLNVAAMTQSSAAQSGTVCYNSGTGAVTYDSSVGCLTSSMRFKHDWRPLSGALSEVMALQAGRFLYNDPSAPRGEQIGLNAENMLTVEPDLVGYAPDGQLLGVRYQNTVALLVAAVQEQQREIDALRHRRTH